MSLNKNFKVLGYFNSNKNGEIIQESNKTGWRRHDWKILTSYTEFYWKNTYNLLKAPS